MQRWGWLPAAVVFAVTTGNAFSQDFFRDLGTSRSSGGFGPVSLGEYTYMDASPSILRPVMPVEQSELDDKYNFALGPLRFAVAAGIGVEFNDNITLSEHDRLSDVIIRPMLNIEAAWPISETNTLRLSLGASYAKYLDHDEFDTSGLLLSPTSALAFSFQLGQVQLTIRDRISYQEDAYDAPQLSGVARYRRWENQAGLDLDWPINERLNFGGGYDHYNLWAVDDVFSSETRSIDTIYLRPTYQLTPGIKVGLFGSASWIDFDSSERSDAQAVMVGPLVEVEFSPFLSMYLEVGYQTITNDGVSRFDDDFFRELTDDERRLFEDDSDASNMYFKFELAHKASDLFEHALSASRTAELAIGANYYDLWHFEYTANFKGIRNTEFGPSFFYEYYETSGEFNEEANRFGAAIGIRHHLSNSLTLGLDYRFILKDSNLKNADYYQNLALISLHYRF